MWSQDWELIGLLLLNFIQIVHHEAALPTKTNQLKLW